MARQAAGAIEASVVVWALASATGCRPAEPPSATPASALSPAPSATPPPAARTPAPAGPIVPVIHVEPIAMTLDGSPEPRVLLHTAWTGSELLVWGGEDAVPSEDDGYAPVPPHPVGDGAAYDPTADRWGDMPAAPIDARMQGATAWTGTALLIWGGQGPKGVLGDGAAYDPAARRWTRIPSRGAPSPRTRAAYAWTGTALLVWGGEGKAGAPRGDGARYDPAAGRWTALPTAGALTPRVDAVAVALDDGAVMVWGGRVDEAWQADGAILPAGGKRWHPVAAEGRSTAADPVVVWTGREVLVWGGFGEDERPVAEGARYDPVADAWTPMSHDGALVRNGAQGCWTGRRLLVHGELDFGDDYDDYTYEDTLLTLGLYDPALDRWWNATGGSASFDGALAWTGDALLVWGGFDGTNITSHGTRVPIPSAP